MSSWQSKLQSLYFKTPPVVRKAVGSVMRLLPEKFTYGNAYRDTLLFLEKTDRWTRQESEQYQLKELSKLITHCWEQIPFYKEYWSKHGFDPSMFKKIADIQKIPTIDKDIIREAGESFIPRDKGLLDKADLTSTGGTSGHQFRFYIDKRRLGIEQAFRVDQWMRFGYKKGDARAVFRGVVDFEQSGEKVYMHEPILNEYRFNVFNMNPKTMPKYV